MHGPYINKRTFWEEMKQEGYLKDPRLKIGGDLNLTISSCEVCGVNSRLDTLAFYFNGLFSSFRLVDVHCIRRVPT